MRFVSFWSAVVVGENNRNWVQNDSLLVISYVLDVSVKHEESSMCFFLILNESLTFTALYRARMKRNGNK